LVIGNIPDDVPFFFKAKEGENAKNTINPLWPKLGICDLQESIKGGHVEIFRRQMQRGYFWLTGIFLAAAHLCTD
jgi:hypothetical protein